MKIEKMTMKQARVLAGLTQVELAKKLGVSTVTYSSYEKGRIEMRVNTAIKFSTIVNVPVENLIF